MLNTKSQKKEIMRRLLVGVGVVVYPTISYGATLKSIIETKVLPILTSFINLIMTLSVLMFVVGIIRFMHTAGDDKSRSEGKQLMIWGTIALFVMVTVWGLVGIIKTSFFGS